jgi:tellurite resistance protein TerC
MEHTIGFPVGTVAVFVILALFGIILDLYLHKEDKPISLKEASMWSVFWIFVSVLFGGFLWINHGAEAASLFYTGYALEKVLSVDNLFVFMAIFSWFSIPDSLRHRVLYWGIIGAIIFRLIFVAIGTSLLAFGAWVEIVFGLIVGWTAWMMVKAANEPEEEIEDYSTHFAYHAVSKVFPTHPVLHGNKFFARFDGILYVTPLFLCLAIVEVSDVMFAFDSVPAVIAVSKDPLIVYSAMIFAILGLRTMYFMLEALKNYFIYLENAVIVILFFIAGKLILNATDHMLELGWSISPNQSLVFIMTMIFGSMGLSLLNRKKQVA